MRRRPVLTGALLFGLTTLMAAAPAPPAKITDTTLPNDLRVIIAEDHGRARVLDRRQLQRRLAQRAQGPNGIRASLRAHDVQGIRERRDRTSIRI
jgi:hypothetical protein